MYHQNSSTVLVLTEQFLCMHFCLCHLLYPVIQTPALIVKGDPQQVHINPWCAVFCPCQSTLVGPATTTQQKRIDFDHEIMENEKKLRF
jgi:hypothetical protein